MSAILDKPEIDQLVRMAFLNEDSLKIIAEEGELRGAIGEAYEFRAFRDKQFSNLYKIDIFDMGDESNIIETLILQKHSNKIPPGMPGGSMKVYSVAGPKKARESVRMRRGMIPAKEGLTLEIQM
jgi:hypothetical protein